MPRLPLQTDDGYSGMDGFWVDFMLGHGVRPLGEKFMKYTGCPKGRIGELGEGARLEDYTLPAIEDEDGNRWVPVLENVLEQLLRHAKREE